MATRPGRIAEVSRRRGTASIASRVHVTATGMPLTGQANRQAQGHVAIFKYARYTATKPSRHIEISGDMSIAVGRPIFRLADVRASITREIGLDADIRAVVEQVLTRCFDTGLVVTGPVSRDADVLVVIRRLSGNTSSKSQPTDPVLEFLGKGLKFPFTFQRSSGGAQISTATSSDHAHIHESIRQILGTKKGERFMRPKFGTRLHELIFEQNDKLLYGLIRHEVTEALDEWEPRIIITDVAVGPDAADDHLVLVNIGYRLISTQVEGNLVYPFWRELE